MNGKIDLHMHTTVSDGSDAPEAIVECVRGADIAVFAVTDHDAIKGCEAVRACLREGDPAFIRGVEFSCKDDEGQYHILGYGYDPGLEPIRRVVDEGHAYRMKKVNARLDFIKDEFGFEFPENEIEALLAMDNPGKPHIGNLMVKYGYADTKETAIKGYIDQLHIRNEYVKPEEAIAGILDSGGIPVLAHPFFGSGDQLIVGDEMKNRLKRLMDFGLKGVEAFYSGFSPKMIGEALLFAKLFGLYVTAGSDYHGTNKLIALGDTNMKDRAPLVPGMKRFLEDCPRAQPARS